VTNTEQRRSGQPIAHQTVEVRFRWLVDRRGCFVEEELVGFLRKCAGKGNALLLTGGELQCPVVAFVESTG
jgi:hypothetical protein